VEHADRRHYENEYKNHTGFEDIRVTRNANHAVHLRQRRTPPAEDWHIEAQDRKAKRQGRLTGKSRLHRRSDDPTTSRGPVRGSLNEPSAML